MPSSTEYSYAQGERAWDVGPGAPARPARRPSAPSPSGSWPTGRAGDRQRVATEQQQQQQQQSIRGAGAEAPGSHRRGGGQQGSPEPVILPRNALVKKQVVTRTTGVVLGVVSQMWVDTQQWEVVALDIRPSLLFGEEECILLSSLRQVGDVVLVHDEDVIEEEMNLYGLNALIGNEVLTEAGVYLGKVRDYDFDPENGAIVNIVFDSLGLPLVPSTLVSTFRLSVKEVVSVGPDRIIVLEGTEMRLTQLSVGVLERLALVEPPWLEEAESAREYEYEEDFDREAVVRQRYEAGVYERQQQYEYEAGMQQQQMQQQRAPMTQQQQRQQQRQREMALQYEYEASRRRVDAEQMEVARQQQEAMAPPAGVRSIDEWIQEGKNEAALQEVARRRAPQMEEMYGTMDGGRAVEAGPGPGGAWGMSGRPDSMDSMWGEGGQGGARQGGPASGWDRDDGGARSGVMGGRGGGAPRSGGNGGRAIRSGANTMHHAAIVHRFLQLYQLQLHQLPKW
eukprot:jgi/Mesvir1/8703/Mv02637-RA.1